MLADIMNIHALNQTKIFILNNGWGTHWYTIPGLFASSLYHFTIFLVGFLASVSQDVEGI